MRQLAAHQTLLVREARRCGGGRWKAYNLTFCQQAASNLELDLSQIKSLLYVTIIYRIIYQGKYYEHLNKKFDQKHCLDVQLGALV